MAWIIVNSFTDQLTELELVFEIILIQFLDHSYFDRIGCSTLYVDYC